MRVVSIEKGSRIGNLTLYARFVGENNFEVTFDDGIDETSNIIQKVTTDEKAIKPSNPTKVGYTFDGWYSDKEFGTLFDFDTEIITSNITVYAKWKSLADAYVELQTQLETADATISGLKEDVKTLTDEKDAANTEKTALQGQVAALTGEKTTLQGQVTALTAQLTTCQGGNIDPNPVAKAARSSELGIRFANNIVADKADMKIVIPGNETVVQTKIVVYDMTGNVVFDKTVHGDETTWNLTNKAGRIVANGSYQVIAEVKGMSGISYQYSAKLGVNR